jgi:hypothetical protein
MALIPQSHFNMLTGRSAYRYGSDRISHPSLIFIFNLINFKLKKNAHIHIHIHIHTHHTHTTHNTHTIHTHTIHTHTLTHIEKEKERTSHDLRFVR